MPLLKPYPKMYRHGPGIVLGPFLEDRKSSQGINNLAAYELLKHDLKIIFEYIEPNSANDNCYSHRNYELLLRACTEVESLCKQIFDANHVAATNIKRYSDLNGPLKLSDYAVRSYGFSYPDFNPFSSFANPDREQRSPEWYRAYNRVKHNRLTSFPDASLKSVIHSVGGVYVLLVSRYGLGFDHVMRSNYAGGQEDTPTFFRTPILPIWPEAEQYSYNWQTLRADPDPYQFHTIPVIP